MSNDHSNHNDSSTKKKFDLEERTSNFAINIIGFCKRLPQDAVHKPIVNQLVRSGTSIGANYSEANESNSKRDFINKIAITKKECNETKYWLRLIAATLEIHKFESMQLFREAQELTLIFAAIIRNSKT